MISATVTEGLVEVTSTTLRTLVCGVTQDVAWIVSRPRNHAVSEAHDLIEALHKIVAAEGILA